jgi:lipopolysaccharide biosynthesis regulator YciM
MDLSLLSLIAICATFGFAWWLSRRDIKITLQQKNILPEQYFTGLKYLLNERPDLAIDSFIEVAKIDPTSIDLHLSLGQMFRRQGEFSQAIRLNTYLSDRSDLSPLHQKQVRWHLAQDYYKAGMYDRAENILKSLLQQLLDTEQESKSAQPNATTSQNTAAKKLPDHHSSYLLEAKQPNQFKKQILDLLLKIANWEQDWHKAAEYLPFLSNESAEDQAYSQKLKTHILLNRYELDFLLWLKNVKNESNHEQANLFLAKVEDLLQNNSKHVNHPSQVTQIKSSPSDHPTFNFENDHPRALLLIAHIKIIQNQEAQALQICQNLLDKYTHLHLQVTALVEKTQPQLQSEFWQKYLTRYFTIQQNGEFSVTAPLNESVIQAISQPCIDHQTHEKMTHACFQELAKLNSTSIHLPVKNAILTTYLDIKKRSIDTEKEKTYPIDGYIMPHLHQLAKQENKTYICDSCGFVAKNFSWSCPGCREWDTLHIKK